MSVGATEGELTWSRMPLTSRPRSTVSRLIRRASIRSESQLTKSFRSYKSRILGSCRAIIPSLNIRSHLDSGLHNDNTRSIQVLLLRHALVRLERVNRDLGSARPMHPTHLRRATLLQALETLGKQVHVNRVRVVCVSAYMTRHRHPPKSKSFWNAALTSSSVCFL